jgi:hypothetical protein
MAAGAPFSGGAACGSGSNFTLTSFDTPGSCMVTPYSACAASMVRLAWVMTMNCVSVRHFLHQPRQPQDVRLVQRRVHLVQNAERARRVAENRHQQRHRGQRFLAARKQQHVLQALAGRRRDMMSIPLSARLVSSVRRISPWPPPNSVWNICRKCTLMRRRPL